MYSKRWPFAFNFLLYGSFAFVGPYFVLYYRELGFSGAQIGLLTGLTPLITLLGAPLWTGLADATNRHRIVMGIALAGGIAGLVAFPFLSVFWIVLLNAAAFNLFFSPVAPLIDSATMHMLGSQKGQYGRIRLGGTLGFALAATLAGSLIERYDLRVAFWGASAILLITILIVPRLSFSQVEGRKIQALRNFAVLLRSPRWALFLALALTAGVGMGASLNYFLPYMDDLGMPESSMGLALTLGTITEVPVLFFGENLLRRFSSGVLLLLGMLAFGLRFFLLGLNAIPWVVFALQILLGIGFPALWIAGVAFADENAPEGLKSSAQGLFAAMIFGFGSAVGGLIGGPMLESIGGRGLHLVYGSAILLATCAIYLADRRGQRAFSPGSP